MHGGWLVFPVGPTTGVPAWERYLVEAALVWPGQETKITNSPHRHVRRPNEKLFRFGIRHGTAQEHVGFVLSLDVAVL